MKLTAIFINIFALVCLLIAFLKDNQKAKKSIKIAVKSFIRIMPVVLSIIFLIGLILGFIPQEEISRILGEKSGFVGILVVGFLGAIMHIPSIISFPLAASLIRSGASVTVIATFITTLTMIGTVTFPLEIKELGKEMAALRNGISFIIAIIIGIIIGVIL
ncbi:permease [candidate division KSB1 bacterium]|nr:MAG: permease [candidate division KSB1 bacterium]